MANFSSLVFDLEEFLNVEISQQNNIVLEVCIFEC
jgi:hypothetical protein